MKRIKLLLLVIIPSLGYSQYQQYPLVEWFTNTYCGICSSRNPSLKTVYDKYNKVHRITIHPSVPYSQCPLYGFNKEDNGARQQYYSISGTPTLYINGERSSSSSGVFESDLTAKLGGQSTIAVEVDESTTNFDRSALVKIKSAGGTPSGNYRLFVAILEKKLAFNAQNGETEHHDVMRDFITSAEGDPMDIPAQGEMKEFDFNYTLPDGVDPNEAYILAFVQNVDDGTILNSGTASDGVSTSLEDLVEKVNLELFPNPAAEIVTVQVGDKYIIKSAHIVNQLGQIVLSKHEIKSGRSTDFQISNLPSGAYQAMVDLVGYSPIYLPFVKE